MTAPNILDVDTITVDFPTRRGTLRALDGVSLHIAAGEVLGVVGESGAGKSLTGAAIIGLLQPPGRLSAGEIRLRGERIDNLPYGRMRRIRGKQIGAIFQDPLTTLNPLYTVGRQLAETMQTHLGLSNRDARARAVRWLEDVGIPAAAQRVDAYPHEFSGGMRQRAMIAIALAAGPTLLLADEPTTALDVTIQDQILTLLLRLKDELGMSMVLVTHDLGVIAETCDRVAVLYAGRVMEVAPAGALFRHPSHAYTLGLLRSLPGAAPTRTRLAGIGGAPPDPRAVPPGCRFAPRCRFFIEPCRTGDRLLRPVEPGQDSACLRAEDVRAEDVLAA